MRNDVNGREGGRMECYCGSLGFGIDLYGWDSVGLHQTEDPRWMGREDCALCE